MRRVTDRQVCPLGTDASVDDPQTLASQLQLIYDSAGQAANLDRNPDISHRLAWRPPL
jgi:hypothetical protein